MTAAATKAGVDVPPPPRMKVAGWSTHERYVFPVRVTTRVDLGATRSFDFDIVGSAAIVPVSAEGESLTLFETIADAQIVNRLPDEHGALAALSKEISASGCFFTLRSGVLSEIRVPRNLSPTVANTYGTLASAFQFPASPVDATDLSADEYDATGEYVANYLAGKDGREWQKAKSKYTRLVGPQPTLMAAPVPAIRSSTWQISFTTGGRLESVHGVDELSLDGSQVPVHSTVDLALDRPTVAPLTGALDWTRLIAATKQVAPSEGWGTSPSLEAVDQARIGAMTFDSVTSALEAAMADPKNPFSGREPASAPSAAAEALVANDKNLFIALSAILREQPKVIPLALKKIRADDRISRLLIEALGTAATPDSQAALIQLMNDRGLSDKTRTQSTAALARTPRPAPASIAALVSILSHDAFNETALFGLGTYARHFRDSGDVKNERYLGELLLQRLHEAGRDSALVTVLRALANAGYDDALPAIKPYLIEDRREAVRAAAARALQSMRAPTVDAMLATCVEADGSPEVRVAAIESMRVRQPTDVLVDALMHEALGAEDPHVRYRAVELMSRWLSRRPDLRETLQTVANRDSEEKVRELAKGAL